MLQRFASAALVAVIAIAVAALAIFLIPGITLQQASPALLAWCCAPCVWGIWVMAAPRSWVPRLLPQWGAILGLIAGVLGVFVLNMPRRVVAIDFSVATRLVMVLVLAAFYYVMWTFVAAAYRRLAPQPVSTPTQVGAKAA